MFYLLKLRYRSNLSKYEKLLKTVTCNKNPTKIEASYLEIVSKTKFRIEPYFQLICQTKHTKNLFDTCLWLKVQTVKGLMVLTK